MINSQEFFKTLRQTWDEIDRQLAANRQNDKVMVAIYLGTYGGEQRVNISISSGYAASEIKVSGVELQELIDEYLRRCGFVQQQTTAYKSLAAPVVEGAMVVEEEIPF